MTTNSTLEKRGPMALERPAFIKEGDTRGTENITTADVKFPALRIAQSMSPEVKRSEAAYVEGLREGDLFNSVTHENYGDRVELLIVNQLGHRHIEFAPQSEGGGVIDFSVPDGDPRTEFSEAVIDGKKTRVRPKATKFYDYLVLVLDSNRNELMTMSLKSTQLKKAVQLNTLLKGLKMPSFALKINAQAVPEKRGNNSYYGWKFDAAGWADESQYNEASARYDKLAGKKIEVATEGESPEVVDEDIPF